MKNKFSIFRESTFTGQRRVGLDSCVLVDLINNPDLFASAASRVFSEKDLFFTHRRCVQEVTEKLIEKKGYTQEDAEKSVRSFLAEKNIHIIERNFSQQNILEEMKAKCREAEIEFHPPDSWIIADFYKAGINKVYSANEHFRHACSLFGMDGSSFPTLDRQLNDTLREMFRQRR